MNIKKRMVVFVLLDLSGFILSKEERAWWC